LLTAPRTLKRPGFRRVSCALLIEYYLATFILGLTGAVLQI